MSTWVSCLVGLMVWFGERGVRGARRGSVLDGIGGKSDERASGTESPRALRALPGWLPWVMVGLTVGGVAAGWIGALIGVGGVFAARTYWSRHRAAKVAAARDDQLADVVRSISAALRAGLSVTQALGYAAEETPAPLREALRKAVDALDLGLPLEDVLDRWADDVDSDDARLLAGVLRLHRRSGGDLPAVLDQVATTLRERRAATREVRALSAQARLSGVILGFLPVGFFGFLWLTSRSDIQGAFRTPAGIAAISIGLVLEFVAFLWIRHLLEVT